MPKQPRLHSVVAIHEPHSGAPASLGPAGREQWDNIQREYDIADSGGLAMPEQACAAWDRAAVCAERIATEGMTIETKNGLKNIRCCERKWRTERLPAGCWCGSASRTNR